MRDGRRIQRQEEDRRGSEERRRAVGRGWPGIWQLIVAVMFLVIATAADDDHPDDDQYLDKLALCVVGRVEEGPALALALHTVLRALPGTGVSRNHAPPSRGASSRASPRSTGSSRGCLQVRAPFKGSTTHSTPPDSSTLY